MADWHAQNVSSVCLFGAFFFSTSKFKKTSKKKPNYKSMMEACRFGIHMSNHHWQLYDVIINVRTPQHQQHQQSPVKTLARSLTHSRVSDNYQHFLHIFFSLHINLDVFFSLDFYLSSSIFHERMRVLVLTLNSTKWKVSMKPHTYMCVCVCVSFLRVHNYMDATGATYGSFIFVYFVKYVGFSVGTIMWTTIGDCF